METLLPAGVNSPVRAFKGLGVKPMIARRGQGALVWDSEGKSYIDFCGSWGALLHGHAHPQVVAAAQEAVAEGSSFGITCEREKLLAQAVQKAFPSMELMRFVSSGTEATMSAVRVARGFTGRKKIVKFIGHYHGHADHFLVRAGSGMNMSSSAGVPQEFVQHTICLPFNVQVEMDWSDVAAVIVEPVAGNMGVVPPQEGYLQWLRQVTAQAGALLIFDEVITGFRVAKGGAQALYNIRPDLTCLGKIVGGGFPAACFGGRKEIMEMLAPLGPVYQAGTLSGNPVAMAAGLKNLELIDDDLYNRLEAKTKRLTDPLIEALKGKNGCIQRVGSMFTLFLGATKIETDADLPSFEHFPKLFQHLYTRGIYAPPYHLEAWFVSDAMTNEQIDTTREVLLEYTQTISRIGNMPRRRFAFQPNAVGGEAAQLG